MPDLVPCNAVDFEALLAAWPQLTAGLMTCQQASADDPLILLQLQMDSMDGEAVDEQNLH